MIHEGMRIRDLVDTIEYQLKQVASAEDAIEARYHVQPDAMAFFNAEIRRLRDILDQHLEPPTTHCLAD
jgi:hypothetical protein